MADAPAPSVCNATQRRRVEPWEFEASFHPQALPKETYLLYEITWGASHKVWRHTAKNTDTQHVEVNFLESLKAWRSLHCSLVWFLSWSPCSACASAIRAFLAQHPKVTLVICVARLFQHRHEPNRQGLRDLLHSGVTLKVMGFPEYNYCWKQFVNFPPGQEAQWPPFPAQCMALYALELYCVARNLPSCVQISKQRDKQYAFFSLWLRDCHFQKIPPPLLLATGLLVPVLPWR